MRKVNKIINFSPIGVPESEEQMNAASATD